MENIETGPALLISTLLERYALKNDAALSRALQVAPPVISKWRHGSLAIGPAHLLRIHETFGMPVAEIRQLANLPRAQA